MGLIIARRTMGFKLEGTPYTAETLAIGDYNVPAYGINYDADVPVKDRKLARGDYSHDIGVAGRRKFSCSFSVDLQMGAAAATAPVWAKCMQACGLLATAYGATGIGYTPSADKSNVPATIEVCEKEEGTGPVQVVIKASGCMGNMKVIMNAVGEPVRIDFEFQGCLVSITDRAAGSVITPTGFNTGVPEAVLGATCTAFAEAQRIGQMTLDVGNAVELWSDPTSANGYHGAHVVGRDSVLDIDPDMDLIANRGNYARHIANTVGMFVFQTNNFTLTAPQAQIIQSYKPGEREAHTVNNIRFRLCRDSLGNDEFTLLQRSKT